MQTQIPECIPLSDASKKPAVSSFLQQDASSTTFDVPSLPGGLTRWGSWQTPVRRIKQVMIPVELAAPYFMEPSPEFLILTPMKLIGTPRMRTPTCKWAQPEHRPDRMQERWGNYLGGVELSWSSTSMILTLTPSEWGTEVYHSLSHRLTIFYGCLRMKPLTWPVPPWSN